MLDVLVSNYSLSALNDTFSTLKMEVYLPCKDFIPNVYDGLLKGNDLGREGYVLVKRTSFGRAWSRREARDGKKCSL